MPFQLNSNEVNLELCVPRDVCLLEMHVNEAERVDRPSRLRRTVGNVLAVMLVGVCVFIFASSWFNLLYVIALALWTMTWEIGMRLRQLRKRVLFFAACSLFCVIGYLSAWISCLELESFGRLRCVQQIAYGPKIELLTAYTDLDLYWEYVDLHAVPETRYLYSDAHVQIIPYLSILHYGGERHGRIQFALCCVGFTFSLWDTPEWYSCS